MNSKLAFYELPQLSPSLAKRGHKNGKEIAPCSYLLSDFPVCNHLLVIINITVLLRNSPSPDSTKDRWGWNQQTSSFILLSH